MANVLITGGSRGIGRACVRAFCARGDRVVFLYHKATAEAEALAARTGAYACRADIRDPAQAEAAVRNAAELLGGIDVLVNNAGISQIKLFTDLSDEDWRSMLQTNLDGAFYVTRAAAKHMISQKSGKIINVSSVSSILAVPGQSVYSATKGAVNSMTQTMAKELAPYGIQVNAVAPGFIGTDMIKSIPVDLAEKYLDSVPMKRFGTAEDVADCVASLLSDAFNYMTGQVIVLDGGLSL